MSESPSKEVRIVQHGSNCFDVHYEGRYADRLTFDEALGLVAALLMPEKRPCMQWLRTPEQWQAWHDRLDAKRAEREAQERTDEGAGQ